MDAVADRRGAWSDTLQEIYDAGRPHGTAGTLTVNGRDVEWFPLAHPGLLKGTKDPAGAKRRWLEAHDRWRVTMKRRRPGTDPVG